MDVSQDPHDLAAQFSRPVDDLRRLLAFHGLRSGAPDHLAAFARKLEDSKPFRTDLTALLRSTRDLEHGRLTSDAMLAIVAVAIGGEALLADPAASPATTHTITLVLMLLAGIGGWSDTGSRAAADPARTSVPPAAPRDPSPPLRSRFAAAAAQTPPPESPAADVRAFVRFDAHSEARSEARSQSPAGLWPDTQPQPDTQRQPPPGVSTPAPPPPGTEARSEAPHILRREPISEIVRPSASPAAPPDPPQRPLSNPERTAVQTQASPQVHFQPEPPPHTQPQPYPPSESQPWPAAASAPPHAQAQPTPVTAWRPPAHAAAAPTNGSTSPAAYAAESPYPAAGVVPPDSADPDTEPTSLSAVHRQHPTSRKPTLNAILATAAVGLLAFGIFEGVHSRTATPATQTASQTGTQTGTQPAPPATPTPTPTPSLAPDTASLPPAELPATTSRPTPETTSKAATPPTHTAAAEDLPPATPSPSRGTSAPPRPRRDAPATLTRAAGLQPSPHSPVAVPESTMNGHLLATRKPVYPPSALAQDVAGTVVLRAFISADGAIRRTDVLSGPPLLVDSALAAASWRRYRPFLVGGRPVEVQTEITYHYVAP